MFDIIAQIGIVLLGGASIWLVSRTESWMRWGYILGLLSIPFYLYATAKAEQWGMFAVSFWYAYSWIQGIWFNWIKPWRLKLSSRD